MRKTSSKLTMKIQERCEWDRSGVLNLLLTLK